LTAGRPKLGNQRLTIVGPRIQFGLIVHRRFDERAGRSTAMHERLLCREAAPDAGHCAAIGVNCGPNWTLCFEHIP
jgi:hypothetical protein